MSLKFNLFFLLSLYCFLSGSRASRCPDSWDYNAQNNKCYFLVRREMTFNESREYCVAIHPKATVIHKNDNLNIYNFMAPFWVNHPENNCFLLEPFGKLIKANCSSLANFICETKVSEFTKAISRCPPNWIFEPRFSRCYYEITNVKTWLDADKKCLAEQEKSGLVSELVSITSSEENEFVKNLTNKNGDFVTLGAIGNPINATSWSWIDGSFFNSFTNWRPSFPQNLKQKSIILMDTRTGQWFNYFPQTTLYRKISAVCKSHPIF